MQLYPNQFLRIRIVSIVDNAPIQYHRHHRLKDTQRHIEPLTCHLALILAVDLYPNPCNIKELVKERLKGF